MYVSARLSITHDVVTIHQFFFVVKQIYLNSPGGLYIITIIRRRLVLLLEKILTNVFST